MTLIPPDQEREYTEIRIPLPDLSDEDAAMCYCVLERVLREFKALYGAQIQAFYDQQTGIQEWDCREHEEI